MIPYNDLTRIHDPEEYLDDIKTCIQNSEFIGDKVFSKDFAEYTGSKYCIPCANGTDAITIALMSLDLPDNSKVAVPAISYAATAAAVVAANHTPVFVDVDPETGLMDVGKIPDVQCAIPVHLYGQCVDVSRIKVPFIEDCAQAHGATIDGKHVGNFGKLGCFSFYPGKNLGAMGDAGGIITNDESLYLKCKSIASLGASSHDRYMHIRHGINSRMDSMQGYILSRKLKKLDQHTDERVRIGELYNNSFGNMKRSTVGKDVYHVYTVLSDDRSKLIKHMKSKNIQYNIHYPHALNKLPCFEKYYTECPNAESFCKKCTSIPLFPGMTIDEIDHVIKNMTGI